TLVGEGLAVSDAEVAQAVAFAFHELKLVVEPGGAVALAALLARKVDVTGKIAVAVLSGGNVDPELFHRLVAESKVRFTIRDRAVFPANLFRGCGSGWITGFEKTWRPIAAPIPRLSVGPMPAESLPPARAHTRPASCPGGRSRSSRCAHRGTPRDP